MSDHLSDTFTAAERTHPDLMEPYSCRIAEARDHGDRVLIMRAGLAATFRRRYPMAEELWPKATASPEEACGQP